MFKRKLIAACLAAVLTLPVLTGCSGGEKIVVGSKDFTENQILAEMMAQLIEKKNNLPVERKINMGGTLVCFEAIQKGQIDLYPEYTGTSLMEELKLPLDSDSERVYQTVSEQFKSKYHIKWLKPFGFNNTYALAVPAETAQKNNLETISDFIPFSKNATFGAEQEFFNRADGYDGMTKAYGLSFKNVVKMGISLKYQAVRQGKINVTDAFTTDGQLKALNLKVLTDDKHYFPPYHGAPIVREETLKKHPEIEETLNALGGAIDDATMQDLNYRADSKGQSIEKVASDFLKEKGLIE